jgi:hypothetical protein
MAAKKRRTAEVMTSRDSWVLSSDSLDAITEQARKNATAHEWLYEMSPTEQRLAVSPALPGVHDLDPAIWTLLVRAVYVALLKPPVSVLLGVVCDCGEPLENDGYCKFKCFAPQPRAERTFSRKFSA